jgi:hypothetical protein
MSLYISIILQIIGTYLLVCWFFHRGFRLGYLSCLHDYRDAAKHALAEWEKEKEKENDK